MDLFFLLAGSLESRNYHNRTQRTEKQIKEIQKGSQCGAEKRKELTRVCTFMQWSRYTDRTAQKALRYGPADEVKEINC